MADYRAFSIGSDGHIDGSRSYKCASDEDALVWAAQWVETKALEIWCGARFVKRLEPGPREPRIGDRYP